MGRQIAIPFKLESNGMVAEQNTLDNQVAERLRALVGTEPGTRLMLPEFGVALNSLVFEDSDAMIQTEITTSVQEAANRWEPGAVIKAVEANSSTQDGISGVQIDFERIDGPEFRRSQTSGVNKVTVGPGGVIREEIVG